MVKKAEKPDGAICANALPKPKAIEKPLPLTAYSYSIAA
jgi:hypothetical protein